MRRNDDDNDNDAADGFSVQSAEPDFTSADGIGRLCRSIRHDEYA
jgi:hypothetical protein